MGHELPVKFAYPEMFHLESLAMFSVDVMNKATVDIQLLEVQGRHKVEGEIIAALIDRNGLYNFRVGSLSVKHSKKRSNAEPLSLASSVVAVPPCGWALHIKVDLKIETGNEQREWKETLVFNHDEGRLTVSFPPVVNGHRPVFQVDINWRQPDGCQHSPPQLCRPVEDIRASNDSRDDLVYTIGDAMSFTEFIMALRRVLAEHPAPAERKDIMDGHMLLNLSSTRQHPLLARTRPEPSAWLHVKLQVVSQEMTSWTSLIMRHDNLYIDGFMNQHGTYGLRKEHEGVCLLPESKYGPYTLLDLDVGYGSLLGATYTANNGSVHPDKPEVVRELSDARLGRDFAMAAVRVLSSYDYDPHAAADGMSVGKALAGLIFMICESARTNPIHNYVAHGWSDGTGFAQELMNSYVWENYWGDGSLDLREWKRKSKYTEPDHRILGLLEDIYLVRDGSLRRRQGRGRPRVELLAVYYFTNPPADGTKIIVFDGKRGQIVFNKKGRQGDQEEEQSHEEQEQGKSKLVLTGPYTGISAEYGCFAIKIDITNAVTIILEWDCDVPECADEVDALQPSHHAINAPGGSKVAEVTYAVMSDALDATVQVKLHRRFYGVGNNDDHMHCVYGKITAFIGAFEEGSVLFSRTNETCQHFDPTDQWVVELALARSVVAVPYGWVLRIELDLVIETSNNKEPLKVDLKFANGIPRQRCNANGYEVEVNAIWYPEESCASLY